MYPVLFQIGPFVISSYGLMLALAFLIGIQIFSWMGKRRSLDNDQIMNLAFIVMISAIVGSRLLYVVSHLEEFSGRWVYTFLPIQPDGTVGLSGLILLGGVLGALIAGTVYVRYKKLPLWRYTDSIAPEGLTATAQTLGGFL